MFKFFSKKMLRSGREDGNGWKRKTTTRDNTVEKMQSLLNDEDEFDQKQKISSDPSKCSGVV